ncbi:hypothetical protein KCP78_08235 [Salmonella enterica subsp. enterica]|nr:hypothetical protein KCP78_08235 [Salmonella enterica subsp. enterica]
MWRVPTSRRWSGETIGASTAVYFVTEWRIMRCWAGCLMDTPVRRCHVPFTATVLRFRHVDGCFRINKAPPHM